MLIEFRVSNFRSIKDEQVLSMVASTDKTMQDTHVVETDIKAVPRLLKTAAIYGANASGKSTVIKALDFMRRMMLESSSPTHKLFEERKPFRLDPDCLEAPSEFEITVSIDGVRYQYGFAMDNERITEEWLLVYKSQRPQTWFQRVYDPQTGTYEPGFGSGLKGEKQAWFEATGANSLLLTISVQLNSAQLKALFGWVEQNLLIILSPQKLSKSDSLRALLTDVEKISRFNGLYSKFGIDAQIDLSYDFSAIDPLSVLSLLKNQKELSSRFARLLQTLITYEEGRALIDVQSETEQMELSKRYVNKYFEELVRRELLGTDPEKKLQFTVEGKSGQGSFSYDEQSLGTQAVFNLADKLLDVFDNGKTLVIDELDTSLHTMLVKRMVQLFYDPTFATSPPQLIFTTHDTTLMRSTALFRRDQYWITDKNLDQATELIAISDYKPRNDENIERNYLEGRYGGIPFIDDAGL